jgi:FixJ family two-component response regulator
MTEQATVYIVDDDPDARESVAAVVHTRGLRVREFDSAEQFLEGFRDEGSACLLVDVRMPGMSGLELQQKLNDSGSSIPTIMITGFGDVSTAVKAMQNGAVTFLEKPCQQDALWEAIDLALTRARSEQESLLRKQELRQRFSKLTANEREVLARVLEGQPNKQIAQEMDLGLRTVELRRSQIMRKLDAGSLSELIRLSIEADFPKDLPPPTERGDEVAE